jgi:internalin A
MSLLTTDGLTPNVPLVAMLVLAMLTAGCYKEETRPTPGQTDGTTTGPSDKEMVEAIRGGDAAQQCDPAFVQLIQSMDKTRGKLTFDKQGSLVGIDLISGRLSANDEAMADLAAAKHLRKLLLGGAGITSKTIDIIATLENLEELTLRDTQVSDDDLGRLAKLAKLKTLNLPNSSRLSDKGVERLPQSKSLRHLQLTGNSVSDAAMPTVCRMQNIELLDVRGCNAITDAGLSQLASLPRLRVLRLGSDLIGDKTLQVVGRCKKLEVLTVENSGISNEGLSELRGLPLKELSLARCFGVTDDGMKTIAALGKLERLYLRDIGITDQGIKTLSAMKNLNTVRLIEIMAGDESAAALARLPRLKSLHFRQAMISAEGLEELAKSTSLAELVMEDCGLDNQGVASLAGLKTLESLNLRDNPEISDEAIAALIKMSSLKQVDLRGTVVTSEGISRLKAERPELACKAPAL